MINPLRYIFITVQCLTVSWAIHYALQHIDDHQKMFKLELQKELETFHIPPSLFKLKRSPGLQTRIAYDTVMINSNTTKSFLLTYFDYNSMNVSGWRISNTNFQVARKETTFFDKWLVPKKPLGHKLLIEYGILKENLLQVYYAALEKKFYRLYKVLGCVLLIAFMQSIIKLLYKSIRSLMILLLKTTDFCVIIFDSVPYYRFVDIIHTLQRSSRESYDNETNIGILINKDNNNEIISNTVKIGRLSNDKGDIDNNGSINNDAHRNDSFDEDGSSNNNQNADSPKRLSENHCLENNSHNSQSIDILGLSEIRSEKNTPQRLLTETSNSSPTNNTPESSHPSTEQAAALNSTQEGSSTIKQINAGRQIQIVASTVQDTPSTSNTLQTPVSSITLPVVTNASNTAQAITPESRSDDSSSCYKKKRGSREGTTDISGVPSFSLDAFPPRVLRQPRIRKSVKTAQINNGKTAINTAVTSPLDLLVAHSQVDYEQANAVNASVFILPPREVLPPSESTFNFVFSLPTTSNFNQTNTAQDAHSAMSIISNAPDPNTITAHQALHVPVQEHTQVTIDTFQEEIDDILAEILAPNFCDPSDETVDIFNDTFPYNLQQANTTQPNASQCGPSQLPVDQVVIDNSDIEGSLKNNTENILREVMAHTVVNDMENAMFNNMSHIVDNATANPMHTIMDTTMDNTMVDWAYNYYMINPMMDNPMMDNTMMDNTMMDNTMVNPIADTTDDSVMESIMTTTMFNTFMANTVVNPMMTNTMAVIMADPVMANPVHSTATNTVTTAAGSMKSITEYQGFQTHKQRNKRKTQKQNWFKDSTRKYHKQAFKKTFKTTLGRMAKIKRTQYLKRLFTENLNMKTFRMPGVTLFPILHPEIANNVKTYTGKPDSNFNDAVVDKTISVINDANTDAANTNAAITDNAIIDTSITNASITDTFITNTSITNTSIADAAIIDTAITDAAVTDAAITNTAITESIINQASPVGTDSQRIRSPLTDHSTIQLSEETREDNQADAEKDHASIQENYEDAGQEAGSQRIDAEADTIGTMVRQNAFYDSDEEPFLPDSDSESTSARQCTEQIFYDDLHHNAPDNVNNQEEEEEEEEEEVKKDEALACFSNDESIATSIAKWTSITAPYSPLGYSAGHDSTQDSKSYNNHTIAASVIDRNDFDNDSTGVSVTSQTICIYPQITGVPASPQQDTNMYLPLSTTLANAVNEIDVINSESDTLEDLIKLANAISVDDETISTPPFFPSPSRRQSLDIMGQPSSETQGFYLTESSFSIKRRRELTPEDGHPEFGQDSTAIQEPLSTFSISSEKRPRQQL